MIISMGRVKPTPTKEDGDDNIIKILQLMWPLNIMLKEDSFLLCLTQQGLKGTENERKDC